MVSQGSTFRLGRIAALLCSLVVVWGPSWPVGAAGPPSLPSLTLGPTSGAPGTVVTLHGFVPGATTAPPPYGGVVVCLNGCGTGFSEQSVAIDWLGGGRFTARFTVPKTPVLTAQGPLVLRDGRYTIGFTCVLPGPAEEGCGAHAMGSATFTVTGARPPGCTEAHPCAALTLTPTAARPGEMVTVRGYAPLAPMIGGQAFGYELALDQGGATAAIAQMGQVQQSLTGELQGTFRMPALLTGLGVVSAGKDQILLRYQFNRVPRTQAPLPPGVTIQRRGKVTPGGTFGYEFVDLAPAPLTVEPLAAWSALGHLRPQATSWSQPLALTHRAGTQGDFAYCVAGGIRLTADGGRTWQRVATEGAAIASMSGPYPISYNLKTPTPHVACTSVLWDPNDRHAFYATFSAVRRKYGSAPPVYSVAYVTRDGGRTWRPVPVPTGYSQGDFGGLRIVRRDGRNAVEAVFARQGTQVPSPTASPTFDGLGTVAATAEVTTNGAASFRMTGLTCPLSGPCLRFGAVPGMYPGMGAAALQPLVTSASAGKSWRAIAWPSGNVISQGTTGQSELVWLGQDRVAYLDAASQYALRVSQDGGRTWQAIALPLPPGSANSADIADGASPFEALMLLPVGDLLAATAPPGAGTATRWWVLAPGAGRWTVDSAITAPTLFGRLLTVGNRLYWLNLAANAGFQLVFTGIASAPLPGGR